MVRALSYEAVLLLLLLVAYAALLLARGKHPLRASAWAQAPILALIALSTVATMIGIAVVGRFGTAPAGSAYVPAHMQDGKLVPPRLDPPAAAP